MSGTQNTGPTSSEPAGAPGGDPEGRLNGSPRAKRRWLPLALIGAAVIVVLIVVIVWTTSAANQNGTGASATIAPATTSAAGADTGGATDPTATDSPAGAATNSPSDPASDERAVSDPHPFDAPADVAPGVTATVNNITSVDGVASGIGETAGPAIRFEVTMTNNGTDAIDLAFTNVLVDYGPDLTPGNQMSGNTDLVPFPASLAAGESATASYVFTVPAEGRDAVRITVDYLASVPLAIFTGAAPAV